MPVNELERRKEERVEVIDDARVKETLAKCLDSLDNISHQLPNLSTDKPLLESLVEEFRDHEIRLTDNLSAHPLFGHEYCRKFSHDLDPTSLLRDAIDYHESPPIQGLKTTITTVRHLLGSVELEFSVNYSQVDLNQLAQEVIDYFTSVDKVLNIPEDKQSKIKFVSRLEPKRWLVFTQEDALFRILYNLITNSKRAISRKYGEQEAGGEIKFSARKQKDFTSFIIEDNGVGFGWFFQKINLKTSKNEILLTELLKHGEDISWFKEAERGTGSGLGICQHLADLIGAEIFITNPEKTEGARASIKLPTKQ